MLTACLSLQGMPIVTLRITAREFVLWGQPTSAGSSLG
jgi:hypothetical protein